MKLIPLSKGKFFAKIDDEDYELVSKHNWTAKRNKQYLYAYTVDIIDGKINCYYMHRIIMSLYDRKMFVDHRNHDTLDNTKSNLRICTSGQNKMNGTSAKNSTSKYLGVCNQGGRWRAKIKINYKCISLGMYDLEDDAAKAYDIAAKKYHGEFASLNFKD